MQRMMIKVSLRLYAGDKEKLQSFYPRLGYNAAIRELVRRHTRALDAKLEEKQERAQVPNEPLDLEVL